MTQEQRLDYLIARLLGERPEYAGVAVPAGVDARRRLLRALMNVRPPEPVDAEFLRVQDEYLGARLAERGVVYPAALQPVRPGIYLWQGDITRLAADAIVNAANSGMLGCFAPCHGCIDNAIHTYAGVQLRLECARIMAGRGEGEMVGRALLTRAYNLPSRYVLHTVGPIVRGEVTGADCAALERCYRACLDAAAGEGLGNIALCCISTGEYCFPGELAARIAVRTVDEWRRENRNALEVIFNVFKDADLAIYKELI